MCAVQSVLVDVTDKMRDWIKVSAKLPCVGEKCLLKALLAMRLGSVSYLTLSGRVDLTPAVRCCRGEELGKMEKGKNRIYL